MITGQHLFYYVNLTYSSCVSTVPVLKEQWKKAPSNSVLHDHCYNNSLSLNYLDFHALDICQVIHMPDKQIKLFMIQSPQLLSIRNTVLNLTVLVHTIL